MEGVEVRVPFRTPSLFLSISTGVFLPLAVSEKIKTFLNAVKPLF
jgi:hypothetical protein